MLLIVITILIMLNMHVKLSSTCINYISYDMWSWLVPVLTISVTICAADWYLYNYVSYDKHACEAV